MKEYAIYDKNETLVFLGNTLNACRFLEMTKGSFQSEICRVKKGRIKMVKGHIISEIFDETEEECE